MSRVEEKEKQEERTSRENERALDRTPGKAEGDENTVDEALRHQDEQRKSD